MEDINQFFFETLLKTRNSRDRIFLYVLDKFNNNPINIFELGAPPSLDENSRYGNGWSTMFWLYYIHNNGGTLLVCDLNQSSLDNFQKMYLSYNKVMSVSSILEDGTFLLKEKSNYDLIYLDGADDPNAMLQQFNLCDYNKNFILCDDWGSKGLDLRKTNIPRISFKLSGGHEMALFGPDIKQNQEIFFT